MAFLDASVLAPHEGATVQVVDTASLENWQQAEAQSNTTLQGSSSFVPGSAGLFRYLNPMTEAHTKCMVHPAIQILTPETLGWPTQQQELSHSSRLAQTWQAASSSMIGLTDASTTISAPSGVLSSGVPARAPRKRATLDSEAVIRIFSSRHDTSTCNVWAAEQGVTTKAIRDIWNLRTWRQ